MRVDGAGGGGEFGDLDDRDPGGAQQGCPAALDEHRRFQPGDHDPAQAGRNDELGARARSGGAGGAWLQRAIERRPGQQVSAGMRAASGMRTASGRGNTGRRDLGEGGLPGLGEGNFLSGIMGIPLTGEPGRDDLTVRAYQDRADGEGRLRQRAAPGQFDGLGQPVVIGVWPAGLVLPGSPFLRTARPGAGPGMPAPPGACHQPAPVPWSPLGLSHPNRICRATPGDLLGMGRPELLDSMTVRAMTTTWTHEPARSVATFDTLNPATSEVIATFGVCGEHEIQAAVGRARQAAAWWAGLPAKDRRLRLLAWKSHITRYMPRLAELGHTETGKPLADAQLEILLAILHIDWAAKNAPKEL